MPAYRNLMSQAFLRQALSDLILYELLARSSVQTCHQMHYLQMWLEKLCKAYLWYSSMTDMNLPNFLTSHKVIAKVLPKLISDSARRVGYGKKLDIYSIRELCKEIDFLQSTIDDGGKRPDNTEYPWMIFQNEESTALAPVDFAFPVSERIKTHLGSEMIKVAKALTYQANKWLKIE